MVETHWDDLRGRELRYDGHTWELTGDVVVRDRGELLAVDVRQVDGSKHGHATLSFANENPPKSLNPGTLGDHFHRLETDNGHTVVVRTEGRTYRYELHSIEYE
ncbi:MULTISPECIES: hypothetical protein [Salinibaculum]|uniref:hypothetical protein n=1 Tax=Salinibaculum TaxID=2732368 RepID=UPI0030CD705C